jgi:TPR repeat protein
MGKMFNRKTSMDAKTRFNRACTLWNKGELKSAFRLFLIAAKNGDASAQLNLGYFYDVGLGVRKNPDKALYWYRRASKRGNRAAAHNIGTLYRDRGQTQKALAWFHRALQPNDDDSALEIGKVYLSLKGSLPSAIKYLERASRSNNVFAATQEEATRLLRQARKELKKSLRAGH